MRAAVFFLIAFLAVGCNGATGPTPQAGEVTESTVAAWAEAGATFHPAKDGRGGTFEMTLPARRPLSSLPRPGGPFSLSLIVLEAETDLAPLARLGLPESLTIDCTRGKPVGIEPLVASPMLRHLTLVGIDDIDLHALAPAQHLRSLTLAGRVTDAGLFVLHPLRGLRELDLTRVHVSPDALMMLQHALPECRILRPGN